MDMKVIWLVDSFHRNEAQRTRIADAVRCYPLIADATIEPVYVLSPEVLRMSEEEFSPDFTDRFKAGVERSLGRSLAELGMQRLQPLKIIVQPDFNLSVTEVLSDYAARSGADLIVVNSSQHKGISRLLLGSFSEALIADSRVPILALSERSCVREMKTIVVPTDFTLASKSVYGEILSIAGPHESEVILYHRSLFPLAERELEFIRGERPAARGLDPEIDPDPELIQEWLSHAERRHVRARMILHGHSEARTGTAAGILEIARRFGAGMIAMATHTSPIASSIEGSITREVLESATCPVWIHHPRAVKMARPARKTGTDRDSGRFPEAETGT